MLDVDAVIGAAAVIINYAAVAAALGLCHPQSVLGGKSATSLVNLLTRG